MSPTVERGVDVDDLVESYVVWREACEQVATAYAWWAAASAEDRGVAFDVYRSALEREDRAASAHRDAVRRLGVNRAAAGRRRRARADGGYPV